KEFYVEGLVHISSLPHDYYRFEPAQHRLVGERTRKIFGLGDELLVRVVRVDLDNRKIDFELESVTAARRGKLPKAPVAQTAKTGKAGKHSESAKPAGKSKSTAKAKTTAKVKAKGASRDQQAPKAARPKKAATVQPAAPAATKAR